MEGVVRLKDRKVFTLSVDREGHTAVERARHATQALERACDGKAGDARVERGGGGATVYVGAIPIVDLDQADAEAAGASSLDVYSAALSSQIQAAIVQERRRSAIAGTVFSFALVVFTGLIAFLLLGKVSELAGRAHDWVEDNPERVPSLRVGGVELLRAGVIVDFLTVAIDIAKRVAQFGALYAWILFSCSLFDATKAYTGKLTGFVLGPISTFIARFGSGIPLALATAVAIFAIVLLVQFTGLFFAGVVRGETSLDWVPQDLAAPVGVLVRVGIVVVGLVVAAPLLTGADDGVLARAGVATLLAFGLAATPVLACGIVGSIVVFTRRFRPGDFIEIAGQSGRVRAVTLLEVTVEDSAGCALRIPHLRSLLHPIRIVGLLPIVCVELVVDPKVSQIKVRDLLASVATQHATSPHIDLVALDVDGALYRITLGAAPSAAAIRLAKRGRPGARRSHLPPRATMLGHPPPTGSAGPLVTHTPTPESPSRVSSAELTALLADALTLAGIGLGRRPPIGGAFR